MPSRVILMRKVGKGLYKLFKAVLNYISQALPIFVESNSEVSYIITEPRNFSEVTRLSEDTRKPWLKANLKEIKNSINNKTIFQDP